VGIAALRAKKVSVPNQNVALIISGGNVNLSQLLNIAQRYG
jgi:threonine dehydratase